MSTEPTNEPTYDNVTLDPRANVYFDGRASATPSSSPTGPGSRRA
ncbi:hypothetical protein [Nocardioides sp. LML1-1-1.1]